MRIYIRHAHKSYKNGQPLVEKSKVRTNREQRFSYAHDPPLTREGRKAAAKLAEELLSKYPTPAHIITSPYLRARETAAIMAGVIVKKYSPTTIQISCQAELSEYLGNHNRESLDVAPSTAKHSPPHPETFFQFRARIAEHYKSWLEADEETDVTWIITHGIVINELLHTHYHKRPIPYLGYMVMTKATERPKLFFGG